MTPPWDGGLGMVYLRDTQDLFYCTVSIGSALFHVNEVDGGPEDVELDGDDEHPRQDTLEQGHQRGYPL